MTFLLNVLIYLHVLMPHMYFYMYYHPKFLKMNGLKSRAEGRHMLSSLSSGKWENVASAPLFWPEYKWISQRTQGFPLQAYSIGLHVPCLPLLHIHMRAACNPVSSIPFRLPTQISAVSSKMTSQEHNLKAGLATRKAGRAGFESESYALQRQVAPLKIPPCPAASACAPPATPKTYAVGVPVLSLPLSGHRSLAVLSSCWLPLGSPAPLHSNGMNAEISKTSSWQKPIPHVP